MQRHNEKITEKHKSHKTGKKIIFFSATLEQEKLLRIYRKPISKTGYKKSMKMRKKALKKLRKSGISDSVLRKREISFS